MRNQTICICEKDADRSAVSAQLISVFFLLYIRHKASSFYIRNSKPLGICGYVGDGRKLCAFVCCLPAKTSLLKISFKEVFDFSSNYVQ